MKGQPSAQTDALNKAHAILEEHFPAGIVIVPNGKRRIRTRMWGNKSFQRGLAIDFAECCGLEIEADDASPPDEADAG